VSFSSVSVVVFDLDDTLYPERQFVESGFRAVCAFVTQRGICSVDLFPVMWGLFCDGMRGTIFNSALEQAGIVPEPGLIAQLVDLYRSHSPAISLYSDVPGIFRFCRVHDKKICLLTDGYLDVQRRKVEALNIEDWFDSIVYTDALGPDFWKPHPAGFEKIMDQLQFPAEKHIYVGDNPCKDFAGPNALGWKTVCVHRSDGLYPADNETDNPAYRADVRIAGLNQLVDLLD